MATNSDSVPSSLITNEALYRSELLRQLLAPGRDIDQECGYPDAITPQEYRRIFDREGFAARLVSIYPEECWSTPPSVYEVEDEDKETDFEVSLKAVLKEHRMWHYLERLDVLSGVGRFGLLLLGIDDGKPLDRPVESVPIDGSNYIKAGPAKRRLLYMKVFDESCVQIDTWEKDPTNPRYGMPLFYKVVITNYAGTTTESVTARVHWTRVIHCADGRLNSDVYGTPRLENVFNRVYDVRKIAGGSGEMFWKGGFPGYSTEIDADAEVDGAAVRKEIQQYQHGLQRWLMLQGVKVSALQSQVADPTGHLKSAIMLAALSKGIPYRIFMGTEEAQLAGSQDAKAWRTRVHRRNVNYVGPMIVEETINRLVAMNVLPLPKEATGYVVKYDDPENLTEEQKAAVADKQTSALAKYVAGGVEAMMPVPEFLGYILKMDQPAIKQIMKSIESQLDDDMVTEQPEEEDELEEDEETNTDEEDEDETPGR